MRLIDADDISYVQAIDATDDLDYVRRYNIDRMPTIDAVTVVRCKDCKWWKTNYSWNGKEHKVCVIEPYEPVRKPDDYCSRGERKDDV